LLVQLLDLCQLLLKPPNATVTWHPSTVNNLPNRSIGGFLGIVVCGQAILLLVEVLHFIQEPFKSFLRSVLTNLQGTFSAGFLVLCTAILLLVSLLDVEEHSLQILASLAELAFLRLFWNGQLPREEGVMVVVKVVLQAQAGKTKHHVWSCRGCTSL